MRVGDRVRYDSALTSLRFTRAQVDRVQRQITTGVRIERASDDPAGASSIARLRGSIAELTAHGRSIDDAQAFLSVTENAAATAVNVLTRAAALVTQAQNGGLGQGSRDAIADELESIAEQLVNVANTKYLDRPVFGGFGNAAVAVVGGVVTYTGTSGDEVRRRISPEEVVTVNTDGEAAFGFAAGDDVFAVLQRLADDIRAGDASATATDAGALEARATTMRDVLGGLGARMARLEAARTGAEDRRLALDARRASLEDVDIAEAATELAAATAAYEATLLSIARLDSSSLLDFLR